MAIQTEVKRDKFGRYLPGQSGNTDGKPKGRTSEIKEIFQIHSIDAALRVCELMMSKNEKIAMQACQEILNRALGKPVQAQQIEMTGNMDMRAQIRQVLLEKMSNDKPKNLHENISNEENNVAENE